MTIVRLVRSIDMKAELKKGSEEWEMFQDYWKLCKEVWLPEENDEYWKMVADQAEEFHKKYKTSFSKDLAVALVNYLGEKQKQR